ncbi:hypothetical protein TNCV_3382301 [Trichonephila clavipes]|nr:hypothetical protein TNCV_3382301 [Trichonephila clavipes]
MQQLINRSDSRMVTSQSLGNHGPEVFYWFVNDHTFEDAPLSDAASRVAAAAMVSGLRFYAAADAVETCLSNIPHSKHRARNVAARSIQAVRETCLSSQWLVIVGR